MRRKNVNLINVSTKSGEPQFCSCLIVEKPDLKVLNMKNVNKCLFISIVLLIVPLLGCSSSTVYIPKSMLKIEYVVTDFFLNYNLIGAKSSDGKKYIIVSAKHCDVDSTNARYKKIESGKLYKFTINEFKNSEPLEIFLRSPRGEGELQIDMDSKNSDSSESLIWANGEFTVKVYYSLDICGMNIIRK